MLKNKKAFTLIEILVVVLVLGVLAAIALPLYQRSVYKAHYSNLMPAARAVANGNEIFYLTHHDYTTNINDLDVSVVSGLPPENSYNLVNDENYAYVSVSHISLPYNHHLVFQKNSPNFPGETHCEAAADNEKANWLCKSGLNGVLLGGGISTGYNSYIIDGAGNGTASALSERLANISCADNESSGKKSCDVTVNNSKSVTKTTCTDKTKISTCTYTTYNDDGSQNICYGSRASLVDGECVADKKGTYGRDYDENGNYTDHLCNNYVSGSGCQALGDEMYDEDGTHLAAKNRYCIEWDSQGRCISYQQNKGNDHRATFEDNHKVWVRADCGIIDEDGNCLSYTGGRVEEWDYDEQGRTSTYRDNTCTSMNASMECSEYSNYKTTNYDYNQDGSRKETTCQSSTPNGTCSKTTEKNYNSQGKQVDGFEYSCKTWGSNGQCSVYKNSSDNQFTYNDQGKELTHTVTNCNAYNSQNECTKYGGGRGTYSEYDDNGTTQTSKTTIQCNSYTDSACTSWTVTRTPYVNGKEDAANKTTNNVCHRVNMTNGQCLD